MTTHRYIVEVEVAPDASHLGFTNPHEAAGYVRGVLDQVGMASRGALRVTSLSGPVVEVPPTPPDWSRWRRLSRSKTLSVEDRVRYTLTGAVEYVTRSDRSVVVRADDGYPMATITVPRFVGEWEIPR